MKWCFWTVVLEKTLEESLGRQGVQPAHPTGNQSWIFIGRTAVEAETPVLWPPHAKSWLIGKDSDDGRDWGQEEKGTLEDEMAGWHHWLDERESGWTLGVGVGQGGVACCDSWGRKELDTTERLIWSDLIWPYWFDYYSLVVWSEVRVFDSFSSVLLSQDCFHYSGCSVFSYKVWNFLF